MNHPAASSGVSTKDKIDFIVASDGVLDPKLRNKLNKDCEGFWFAFKAR